MRDKIIDIFLIISLMLICICLSLVIFYFVRTRPDLNIVNLQTSPPLTAPRVVRPKDKESLTSYDSVLELSFEKLYEADHIYFELSNDYQFNDLVFTGLAMGKTSIPITSGYYFLRARQSFQKRLSPWSSAIEFSVKEIPRKLERKIAQVPAKKEPTHELIDSQQTSIEPNTEVETSPKKSIQNLGVNLQLINKHKVPHTLIWSKSLPALYYHVLITRDMNWSHFKKFSVNKNRFHIEVYPGQTYYWKVIAYDSFDNAIDTSETFLFTKQVIAPKVTQVTRPSQQLSYQPSYQASVQNKELRTLMAQSALLQQLKEILPQLYARPNETHNHYYNSHRKTNHNTSKKTTEATRTSRALSSLPTEHNRSTHSVSTNSTQSLKNLWTRIGTGINYINYDQSTSLNNRIQHESIDNLGLSAELGYMSQNGLGAEASYKKYKADAGLSSSISNTTNYEVSQASLSGLYRLPKQYSTVGGQLSLTGAMGVIQSQLPYLRALSQLTFSRESMDLTMPTVGLKTKLSKNNWEHLIKLRYHIPVGSKSSISNLSLDSKLSFDGSIGTSYNLSDSLSLGLTWSGLYYNFDYSDSNNNDTGNKSIIQSTMDLNLGIDF